MSRRRPRRRPAAPAPRPTTRAATSKRSRVAPLGRGGSRVQRALVIVVGGALAAALVSAGVLLLVRGSGSTAEVCPADPSGWNGIGGGPLHRGFVSTSVHDPGPSWSPVWSYPAAGNDAPGTGPPSVAQGRVYTVSADGTLVVLDAATGKPSWSSSAVAGESGRSLVPPALDGCSAVVGTSFPDPRDGQPAGAVRAVDLSTHQRRWGVAVGDEVSSGPQVARGVVFVGIGLRGSNPQDRTFAVEGFNLGDPANPFRKNFSAAVLASPATDGITLWAASFDDNLYAFAVEPQSRGLRQLWSFSTHGILTASPVVGDGVVYIAGNDGNVYAIDAATGRERWEFDTSVPFDVTPVLSGDTLVAADRNGGVVALGISDGGQRWHVDMGAPVADSTGGLAATPERVVVADGSGVVHVLGLRDGVEHGRWRAPASPRGSPALVAGMVLLACTDGRLYALPL